MSEDLMERILRAAKALKAAGAKEVYLLGSTATGETREASDVDLAVSGLPPERYFQAIGQARRILRLPVDVIDLDEPNPITRYLKTEGELRLVG